jgi:NAD(P)-dependent dehydrogenase (short-subunit alcohol dehydrogenase family)
MTGRHDGRRAVVTGGAMGIGRSYALRLAAEGAEVVVADLSDGHKTVDRIRSAGGSAMFVRWDVSDPEAVAALAGAVSDLGGADILVNNAGVSQPQREASRRAPGAARSPARMQGGIDGHQNRW